jgi:integrase
MSSIIEFKKSPPQDLSVSRAGAFAILQFHAPPSDIVCAATPAKRKRGKSLSRRTGQSGHIEKSGRWYVVRYWKDIAGQETRQLVRERICPISGPGLLSKSERKRKAKELIQASGADSPEYFDEVVKASPGEVITFREQSETWLENSRSRKRKPIRPTTGDDIQRALDKWILPEIGDLPLSETAKYAAMKRLVAKMNSGGLSPKSINNYFRIAAAVVGSAEDQDGNSLYPRKWDQEKLDLPIVEPTEQRRPTIDEKTMTFLASCRKADQRMLFILCGATGMRIGEVLGLEIDKHFADDFTTIRVRQQAKGSSLTTHVKTKNAIRDIDVHPEVAQLLRQFIGRRQSGLLFSTQGGSPLNQSNIRNRILYPILGSLQVERGGPHVFRRFRATWLRKQRTPEDLIRLWLGHGGTGVTDRYVNVVNEKAWRKSEAERVGFGFTLPTSVVPNVPKSQQNSSVEKAA